MSLWCQETNQTAKQLFWKHLILYFNAASPRNALGRKELWLNRNLHPRFLSRVSKAESPKAGQHQCQQSEAGAYNYQQLFPHCSYKLNLFEKSSSKSSHVKGFPLLKGPRQSGISSENAAKQISHKAALPWSSDFSSCSPQAGRRPHQADRQWPWSRETLYLQDKKSKLMGLHQLFKVKATHTLVIKAKCSHNNILLE